MRWTPSLGAALAGLLGAPHAVSDPAAHAESASTRPVAGSISSENANLRKKGTKTEGAGVSKSGGGSGTASHDGPRRARKVKGGWRLPGDDTVYPYNPLLPPDMANPVPRRPGAPERKR